MKKSLIPALLLTWTLTAQAAPPTFTYTPLSVPGGHGTELRLLALTLLDTLLGSEVGLGQHDYRISAGPVRTIDPIKCSPAVFTRSPTAFRGGPSMQGMNTAGTVAGDDEDASGLLVAISQTSDGTCVPYLVPGSILTRYTGLADTPDYYVGQYREPVVPGIAGLLSFHCFIKTPTAFMLCDGPGANDRNTPTGHSSPGAVIGYAFRDIQPDNTYTYRGWLRLPDGTIVDLIPPSGADFVPMAITDDGAVVVGIEGQNGSTGGKAWWYETATATWSELALPTPQSIALIPRSVTNGLALAGAYIEKIPTGNPAPDDFTFKTVQFIAIPVVPTPPSPPEAPKKTRLELFKERLWKFLKLLASRHQHLPHIEEVRELNEQSGAGQWQLALDDRGNVVLSNGEQVVGN